MPRPSDHRLTALLGPTNTGKTFYAMERMASYGTGMIGFPLRLLARENYDKFVSVKGRHQVALITGEEKIMPLQPRYFICTVEAMPTSIPVDFLAVDEIQLCGDPERGHIFTDRLLHARGREETLFLGSDTIKPLMQQFLPSCQIETRQRFSELTYTGHRKISRLPRRSAIVAFSVNDVYHIAEAVRAQRGGAALVLGALSPRTRNAQVEMYQNGEVDYLVATDAIGMGLNMDIDHVALAAARKFDGSKPRDLRADEIGQIAGRAGRFKRQGTFGATNTLDHLDPVISSAVENHVFAPLTHLRWRNTDLDFKSLPALLSSLNKQPSDERLIPVRLADDHRALHALAKDSYVQSIATSRDMIGLLWDICQIPDFRQTLTDSHPLFLGEIFQALTAGDHRLNDDWVAQHIKRLNRTDGDIDTLLARIAHIRTWTYVTHINEWLHNAEEWQDKTRRVEDILSDALHDRLMQRFVDRRSHHVLRQAKNDGTLTATLSPDGTVLAANRVLGHLNGWFFTMDEQTSNADKPALTKIAQQLLHTQIESALASFTAQANDNPAKDKVSINDDGAIVWRVMKDNNPTTAEDITIAQLVAGDNVYQPKLVLHDPSVLNDTQQKNLQQFLEDWLKAYTEKTLQPLLALKELPAIASTPRGIAFQVYEHGGVMLRQKAQDLITSLTTEDRQALHNLGIKLGAYFIYHREMLKTAALKHRAMLSRLANGFTAAQTPMPAQGNVSAKVPADAPRDFYFHLGFPVFQIQSFDKTETTETPQPIAVRADMVERVNSAVYDKAIEGVYTFDPALASTIGTSVDALQAVLHGLGFRYEERTVDVVATPIASEITLENSEVAAVPDAAETTETSAPAADNTLGNSEAAAQPDAATKITRVYHLKKAMPFFLRAPREDRLRQDRSNDGQRFKSRDQGSASTHDGGAQKSFNRDKKADFENKFKPKQSPGQYNKKAQDKSGFGNPRDNVIPVKAAKPTGHAAFAGLADLQGLLDAKKK